MAEHKSINLALRYLQLQQRVSTVCVVSVTNSTSDLTERTTIKPQYHGLCASANWLPISGHHNSYFSYNYNFVYTKDLRKSI